ncbi:MAG: DUF937 domain-containing protein [Pontixanthobacter sp.]
MSLARMLQDSGVIDSMAGELGIDAATARTGAGALLPAIVAGMGRSATGSGSSGLRGLAGAILSGGGGTMLDAVLGNKPTPTSQGNDILGNIFGGKDVSRGVAGEVAAMTGIDEAILKKMLPILAMAAAGYMAKKAGGMSTGGSVSTGSGALGGILGSIVSGMAR